MLNIRWMLAALVAVGSLLSAGAHEALAQSKYKLEISLETSPNHVRNISILEIAKELEKASNGKLEVKVYHSAAKFKDTDIPKALNQGAMDMGVPVTFHLGKYVSNFDAVDLPIFYGRTRHEIYKVTDGKVGDLLAQAVEKKLGVKIVGHWMDLGHQQTFTLNTPIKSSADIKGRKIRTPGGAGNIARYDVLGAAPLKVPWPDVPQALQRSTIDGLMTTFESARSAKLWDSGVKFAFENNQSFTQYVPLISQRTWKRYPPEIRDLISKVWAKDISKVRDLAEQRQKSAQGDAVKNGMTINVPTPEDTVATRKKLLAAQDQLVKQLKIDPALVRLIAKALDG
ncbi:MAG: TRAP transporter substrate-binding protein DctP [Hyphomicrobiaceae bacterium]